MLPSKPLRELMGALSTARDRAQPRTHLPAPSRQQKFIPSPCTGLRQSEGARAGTPAVTHVPDLWLLTLVVRLHVGFMPPADSTKPPSVGSVTVSAHLSSPVTDIGRDDSVLSIVICTQNRAEPCRQFAWLTECVAAR